VPTSLVDRVTQVVLRSLDLGRLCLMSGMPELTPVVADEGLRLTPNQILLSFEANIETRGGLSGGGSGGLGQWIDMLGRLRNQPQGLEHLRAMSRTSPVLMNGKLKIRFLGTAVSCATEWRVESVLAPYRLPANHDPTGAVGRAIRKEGNKWIAIEDGCLLGSYDSEVQALDRLARLDRDIALQFDNTEAVEKESQSDVATLTSKAVLDMGSRSKVIAAYSTLASAQIAPGSVAVTGQMSYPDRGRQKRFSCRVTACADLLDQALLDHHPYKSISRRRSQYAGIPAIIESWGDQDVVGRTWIMLKDDVVGQFGEVDGASIAQLIAQDWAEGHPPSVSERDGYVLVNRA
jgi:hypothetical protein